MASNRHFQVVEGLAASLIAASPSDLSTISTLLTQVDACSAVLDAEPAAAKHLKEIRADLEAVILNPGDAALTYLAKVGQQVEQLQDLLAHTPEDVSQPAVRGGSAATSIASPVDPGMLGEFITEATERLDSAEHTILLFESSPDSSELVSSLFRDFHTVKGGAGMVHLQNAGKVAHHAESLMAKIRDGMLRITRSRVDLLLKAVDLLRQQVAECDQAFKHSRGVTEITNHSELICLLQASANNEPEPQTASPAVAAMSKDMIEKRAAANASIDSTIKVSTGRLDTLMNLVGELIISESVVARSVHASLGADHEASRDLRRLQTIARALQDASMSLRMIPLKGLFGRMQRLVRDLAGKTNKDVELALEGSETEIDRNLVEALTEPLMHMVRNSMDHGLEPPEQRVAKGKSSRGRITLAASHVAGNVVIRVSDDGRGLPTEKIHDKAIKCGLMQAGETRSDSEIWKLIFHPGLSTAETVSDLSGRGVGMDVVKRSIDAVRGRIEINSATGVGTEFTIRLPLTLAVIEGLVVTVAEERYVIPLLSVQEAIRCGEVRIAKVCGATEVIRFRDRLLPLCRLQGVLNASSTSADVNQHLVIVRDGDRELALLVGKLVGQQQIVIKSMGKLVRKVEGVAGAAILGDGCVSLILDVPSLIDSTTKDWSLNQGNTP